MAHFSESIRSFGSAFFMSTRSVDYILHNLPLESPLLNIVVVPIMSDINIAAMYVESRLMKKYFDLLFISLSECQKNI